jgi:hypothetical protein
MVYWYDAKKGYYLKVPEYTHPFITEEMFERDFQKACSITRKKRKNAKHQTIHT